MNGQETAGYRCVARRSPYPCLRVGLGIAVFAAVAASSSSASETSDHPVDFREHVAPLLEKRCFTCHGSGKRKGGLSLETLESARIGGDSGPALVPGSSEDSNLVRRVSSDDPDERMPPKGEPLTAEEIQLLRAWIDAGAPGGEEPGTGDGEGQAWQHWAFHKLDQAPLPTEMGSEWVRNPIDAFVLAATKAHGLSPSPEADRYTLIRRVSLDLLGLPPEPEAVAEFVNDPEPDAYEKLVDRLLASPHYGERMAIRWLDAARYADTNGYEKDRPRSVWPYRDWVIDAFNRNLPFDRFTIEQLAGDLLPNATVDQRIATGFLRNSMHNEEGGVDAEEFRFEAMIDRTNTVGTVFLGLTVGCAQCHTHKYDPVTQREYYQFYAFLNNTDDVEMEIHKPAIATQRAKIEKQIAALVDELPNRFPVDALKREVNALEPAYMRSQEGTVLSPAEDNFIEVSGECPERDIYTLEYNLGTEPIDAIQLDLAVGDDLSETGPGRADNGGFVLSELEVLVRPLQGDEAARRIELARAEATKSQGGFTPEKAIDGDAETGWSPDPAGAARGRESEVGPVGQVGQVGGTVRADALTVWFKEPVHADRASRLEVRLVQNHGGRHTLGRFRISAVREYLPESDRPGAERREQYLAKKLGEWEREVASRSAHWTVAEPVEYVSKNHASFVRLDDDSLLLKGDVPNTDTYDVEYRTDLKNIVAVRLEVLPHPTLPNGGPGRGVIMSAGGDFLLSEIAASSAPWLDSDTSTPVTLQHATEDYAAPGRSAGLALDGKLDTGWSIKDKEGQPHAAVFEFAEPVDYDGGTLLRLKLDQVYVHQHTIGRFRVSVTSDPLPVVASGVPADIESIVLTPANDRSDAERATLKRYYLSIAPELAASHREIDALRASMPSYPRTLVLAEREDPRVTHIHHRGEFLQPREPVTPAVLDMLNPMPEQAPPNRLSLARWLVSDANPLTARVTVNRFWEMLFGRGIVATPDDFGVRGEKPTHPELLDWLAVEFMRRGWDVKDIVRLMVTSATYRQSSRVTPELLAADPANEWLARAPRFRVDAEIVRDIAMASSGLLNPTVGGASVRPPLPEGALSLAYPGASWEFSEGADRFRRGLYTYWKRALPYPSAVVFDAPARDTTCVRRIKSNTPLQALTMLNDGEMMESSKAMARRVLEEVPGDTASRIRYAFLLVLSRPPDAKELDWVTDFYNRQRDHFRSDKANADVNFTANMGVDARIEQAAWTLVCRAILNTDEAVTKG